MSRTGRMLLLACLAGWGCRAAVPPAGEKTMDEHGVLGYSMAAIDGEMRPLETYRGRVLLIVNVASRCGFTPQYASLQALFERYGGRGLRVLAFPANDFGAQEPGTNEEIKAFCDGTYGVTFDLFAKISVKGETMHPLYRHLTTRPGLEGDVTWNFNKFLVDRSGRVVARYPSKTDPMDPGLLADLERLLGAP